MAKISIPTRIDIPDKIEIRLVREDHLQTSNIFRIMFEISLSITTAILGASISLTYFSYVHWLFLVAMITATISFLIFSILYSRKSKEISTKTESGLSSLPNQNFDAFLNIPKDKKALVDDIIMKVNLANQIRWKANKVKTEYATLRILGIQKELYSKFQNELERESVSFIDEQIVLKEPFKF